MNDNDPLTTIRFGGYQPERSVHTRAARALIAALSRDLCGQVAVDFTPNIAETGRLAGDLLTMTEAGDLELCYFASSYLADRIPALGLLDLPFEGTDRARIWARLDGAAGDRLKQEVERTTGYAVLGFWDNGIRHISNRKRPIRTPADCAGLSIRTLDNSFHQAIFGALGFKPRFIDVKNLAAAVRSCEIDAQENPLTNIVNFRIQETHRHVTLLGQFFGVALLLANRQAMERWPAAVGTSVVAAAAEATRYQRAIAAEEDAKCLAQIEAEGAMVVTPDASDLAAFKAAVADVVAGEAAKLDRDLLALWRN